MSPTQNRQSPAAFAPNTVDSAIESVPPEILVMIMEAIPDLASLYGLICSCPSAAALFNRDPSHYINKLVENTLPEELWPYPR